MKIAFCFLTIADLNQPAIWETFFAGAPRDLHTVYCHPKHANGIHGPTLAGRIVDESVPTKHGHISIVTATLALFAAAFNDDPDNEYFVLLSESTIPIVPFARIQDELARAEARSLLSYYVPPPGIEHHKRLSSVANPDAFANGWFHHSQWIVLHRRHVEILLDRAHLWMFTPSYAPDEHYFMNVLVHLKGVPLDELTNRATTFVNWRERQITVHLHPVTEAILGWELHPRTYSELSPADLAEAGDAWFFRKIAASCDCRLALPRVRGEAD